MGSVELRQDQLALVDAARRALQGVRRVLLVAPTGAGKTVMAAYKAARALEQARGAVVYAVHRRQLVLQTAQVFKRYGIPATILMAGFRTDFSQRVYVMSRQTWERRRDWVGLGEVDLLLIDEAHIGVEGQKRLIKALEPRFVVGYTATPVTLRGPGLGAVYERLVQGPSYVQLIEEGHLVPTRWVVAKPLDTSGLRVSRATGDYVLEDVVRLVRGQVLADLYDAYMEWAGRRNVIFAPSVDVAATIAARLGAHGVRAAVVDWSTPPGVRARILREFREGSIAALVNVDVLGEGWDEPLVDTIFLASPTRSLARHLQRIGRGMRPAPGKLWVRVVDLVGALQEHGAPEDIEGWELEEVRAGGRGPVPGGGVKRRGRCPLCGEEMKGRRCECGFEPRYRYSQEELEVLGGVLEEVVDGERGGGALWDEESRRLFYLQLLHYAREKRKKDGWAAHVYRERWGVWPKWEWRFLPTVPPSPDVNRYIISRWIRWSRSKKRLWNLGSW